MMGALVIAVSLGLAVAMSVAWLIQRSTNNAGWVDVVWSFALGAAGVVYALYPLQPGPPTARQCLIALLAACWSLRLGLHIAGRTSAWRGGCPLCAVPPRLGRRVPKPHVLVPADPGGRRCVAGGFDAARRAQAAAAVQPRCDRRRRTRLCRSSARRLPTGNCGNSAPIQPTTRAFATSGCGAGRGIRTISSNGSAGWPIRCSRSIRHGFYPWGWFALSAPVFMYWLLVHVSGIPPLEQQMLRSRGDAFRNYQARVSAFIPFPPARSS